MKNPTVITLVHGTFAKNADWTQKDSEFSKMLADELLEIEGAKIFEQVNWSGRNLFRSRQRAAEAIYDKLVDQEKRYENPRQYVIGHSHGGSALAYLISSTNKELKSLSGCIFLSTPFIDARARKGWDVICSTVISLFGVMLFPILYFLYAGWFASQFDVSPTSLSESSPSSPNAGEYLLVVPIIVYIGLIYWIARPSRLRAKYDVEGLADRLSTSNLARADILIVKTTGDEALSALSATHFLSWASTLLLDFSLSPFKWAMRLRLSAAIVLIMLIAFVTYGTLMHGITLVLTRSSEQLPLPVSPWGITATGVSNIGKYFGEGKIIIHEGIVWRSFTIAAMIAALVVFVYLNICMFILVISVIAHWSFGRFSIASALFMELAVEAMPRGSHDVFRIPWDDKNRGGLAHSGAYQDDKVVEHIGHWIVARTESR